MKTIKQIATISIIGIALFSLFAFSASAAYQSYRYKYYNFKIDTTTGALVNLTVAGKTTPVLLNISSQSFNATSVRLIPYAVNISVKRNNSVMDIIKVSYGLKVGNTRACIVNDSYKIFKDNQTGYYETQIESAGSQICPLYKNKIDFYTNGANFFDRLQGTTTNTWRGAAFSGSNTWKSNYSVYSGTCSNSVVSYNNESYMIVVNGSSGWALLGAVNCDSAMSIGYQSEMYSLSYLIADTNDTLELGTNVVQTDYIGTHPNKSISVYDGATNKYVRLEVAYPGLTGFIIPQGATWRLRPNTPVRNKIVAKDFFRAGYFFQVRNATTKQSYRTPVQALRTDALGSTYGELSFVNGKYITERFMPYDGRAAGFSKINVTYYPTQAHLRVDMNHDSKIGLQTHLDYCFETIERYAKDGGWWRYWDIQNAIYEWGGDAFLGNGLESMYSCNKVLGSSWLNAHRDVKNQIYTKWLDASKAYKVNTNVDKAECARQRYVIRSDQTRGFEANRSCSPTIPEFKAPAKNISNGSGFYVYVGTTTGPEAFAIYQISCNTTGGKRLLFDDFQADTSANYNKSGWGYDATRKRLVTTSRTPSGTDNFGLKNATANNSDWQNVVCSFDVEATANLTGRTKTSTQVGYIIISPKRNYSAAAGWDNAVRYYYYGQSTAGFKYGSRSGSTWKFILERNDSAGIYSTDYTLRNVTRTNTTAYMALTNPKSMNLSAASSQIINQNQYFDLGVAISYHFAALANRTANKTYYGNFLDNVMQGMNWLFNINNIYFRRDGFWQYSSNNMDHDGGYYVNSNYELSKILRAKPGTKQMDDLPFICYYNRYGRENRSETSPATNFSRVNALLAMSDTRCAQYTMYKAKINPRLESENVVMTLYPQETETLYFPDRGSNCSYIFNNKIGIYYPDSHIIAHSNSSNLVNVRETCTNVRIKSVNYAWVDDAYQTNGTTDIYVKILPINRPRHSWNSASAEAYPLGTYNANSPMWDFTLHRWLQNSTHFIYNSSSFIVTSPATITIAYANALPSKDYTVSVNGVDKVGFVTDLNGNGLSPVFAGAANANVSIQQRLMATGKYQLVTTNITNNTILNISRLNGYIGGRYMSKNITSAWVSLIVDGAVANWKKINNATWTGFSSANITVGKKHIIVSTDYNQTREYVLYVRNVTGHNVSTTRTYIIRDNADAQKVCKSGYSAMILLGVFAIVAIGGTMISLFLGGSMAGVVVSIIAAVFATVIGGIIAFTLCSL